MGSWGSGWTINIIIEDQAKYTMGCVKCNYGRGGGGCLNFFSPHKTFNVTAPTDKKS